MCGVRQWNQRWFNGAGRKALGSMMLIKILKSTVGKDVNEIFMLILGLLIYLATCTA